MRILLSFMQDSGATPHAIPAYRFWTNYIKNGIDEAGMKWMEIPGLDWAAGMVPYEKDPALEQWKQQAWAQTVDYVKTNRQHFDIFLCYLYPKQIDTNAIKQIRDMGVPCVNFYCDNIRSFSKLPPEFKIFDLVWVPEFEALNMYQTAGVAHIHLPMPMWVKPEYRTLRVRETDAITFIGSKDYLRAQLLASVIDKGLPVQIGGSGWHNENESATVLPASNLSAKISNQLQLIRQTGLKAFAAYHVKRFNKPEPVVVPPENLFEKPDFEAYIRLSRESMITLGINRVPTFHNFGKNILTYSRLRDLEAPMLGACYLTEYTEGLTHLYELGTDIETYTDADELVLKSRELSRSESKRKELRAKSQQKALGAHSIPKSLQKIKTRLFN